jgi:hypothetical protein
VLRDRLLDPEDADSTALTAVSAVVTVLVTRAVKPRFLPYFTVRAAFKRDLCSVGVCWKVPLNKHRNFCIL